MFSGYTDWAPISRSAYHYLNSALLSTGGLQLAPTSLAVKISDQFIWKPPYSVEDIRSCLKSSPYLSESLFSQAGLWHSHHGFFTELPGHKRWARRLDVLEVGVIEPADEPRILTVNMMHKFVARHGIATAVNRESLAEDFDALHAVHTAIFKDILSGDMHVRVGFQPV